MLLSGCALCPSTKSVIMLSMLEIHNMSYWTYHRRSSSEKRCSRRRMRWHRSQQGQRRCTWQPLKLHRFGTKKVSNSMQETCIDCRFKVPSCHAWNGETIQIWRFNQVDHSVGHLGWPKWCFDMPACTYIIRELIKLNTLRLRACHSFQQPSYRWEYILACTKSVATRFSLVPWDVLSSDVIRQTEQVRWIRFCLQKVLASLAFINKYWIQMQTISKL